MKKRIDRLDFTEIKIFCLVKRMKRKATDMGENIGKKHTIDKGLLSKIYKELLKINNKKIKN